MRGKGEGTSTLTTPGYILVTLLVCSAVSHAQDRKAWQSVSQLRPGDQVRVRLKSRDAIAGSFQAWTPDEVTVGGSTAKRADVTKVERFRKGGWSRGKTAAVGALIGGGAGAAIGVAAGGCGSHGFGPCFTRGQVGAVMGGVGAVVGAVVGLVIPHRRTDVIYQMVTGAP